MRAVVFKSIETESILDLQIASKSVSLRNKQTVVPRGRKKRKRNRQIDTDEPAGIQKRSRKLDKSMRKIEFFLPNENCLFFRKQHHFSPERIAMLRGLSTKDDVYERLASALAPSIYGNLDVKKGILLQLFGGRRKSSEKTGRGKMR